MSTPASEAEKPVGSVELFKEAFMRELNTECVDLKARADALEAALRKLLPIAEAFFATCDDGDSWQSEYHKLGEARRLLSGEAHNGKKGGA